MNRKDRPKTRFWTFLCRKQDIHKTHRSSKSGLNQVQSLWTQRTRPGFRFKTWGHFGKNLVTVDLTLVKLLTIIVTNIRSTFNSSKIWRRDRDWTETGLRTDPDGTKTAPRLDQDWDWTETGPNRHRTETGPWRDKDRTETRPRLGLDRDRTETGPRLDRGLWTETDYVHFKVVFNRHSFKSLFDPKTWHLPKSTSAVTHGIKPFNLSLWISLNLVLVWTEPGLD